MSFKEYYNSLVVPSWALPADWLVVGINLFYVLFLLVFGLAAYQAIAKKQFSAWLLLPFIVGLVSLALYSPLVFRWQLPWLATLSVLLSLISAAVALSLLFPQDRKLAYLNLPVVLWLLYLSALQISIMLGNFF